MNKDVNGNEYTFRTPDDWGTIGGALLKRLNGKSLYREIGPESGEVKFTIEDI